MNLKRIIKASAAALLCMTAACAKPVEKKESVSSEAAEEKEPDILDLTFMSSTAVYSEVLNVMTSPEQYRFRKMKINGIFGYRTNEETGKMIFGCVILDATQCCEQGIEFIRSGDYTFPDDYPEPGEMITVEGTFDYYTDGNLVNLQLKDAVMSPYEENG